VKALDDATPVYPAFVPDKARRGATNGAECPRCSGKTGIRLCPNCHSVLPANFTSSSPMFGIVGVRGSGKTVMLSVLSKELTSRVARRFGAAIDAVGSSNLLVLLDGIRRNMEAGPDGTGELPDQTARFSRRDTVPAVFEWQISKPGIITRTTSTILSFYDTAGEDLAHIDRAREQHYLAATDGLILLIDPFGLPANRSAALARGVHPDILRDTPIQVLTVITEMLRGAGPVGPNKKIKRPLAVVLSKIDAFFSEVGPDSPIRRPSDNRPVFSEKESLDLHHHVATLIDRWGGDDLLRHLQHNYEAYRFFPSSALGAEPAYATGRVSGKGLLPHRVAEPLLWLMADRGFIPKEK
jgi:hypothetical protein